MAIENQPIAPNTLNADKPKSVEEDELLQVIEGVQQSGEGGFIIQDDGSAVLDTGQPDMVESDFNQNLAELIEESDLMNISNQLIDGIEKDKASREDWERTYIDGLKYLGMKFDSERSEPFAGASGVIHPLLGEAVTTFQAQAYK